MWANLAAPPANATIEIYVGDTCWSINPADGIHCPASKLPA